jgi:hypothetical protein
MATISELHELLRDSQPPFTIKTKGGKKYRITDRSHIWAPDAYKEIVALAIPHRGLIFVRLSCIEAVHTEQPTEAR